MRHALPSLIALSLLTAAAHADNPGCAGGVPLAAPLKTGDTATLRRALSAAILNRESTATPEALLKDADHRRALAAHEVLRVTGDEALKRFLAADPERATFLVAFLSDTPAMEAYLSSGCVPTNTDRGLRVLANIWKTERAHPAYATHHHLAAALASIWGASPLSDELEVNATRTGITSVNPVWRYRFFRDKHLAGRLHPMFTQLKSWELRYVVGTRHDDASIAWLNENINLPLRRYPDACWAPVYRGASDFGDHVQGPHFYRPWREFMSGAEMVKTHGGVCGSLSHFGAYAAAAHGIPAYTCGQPGHCAYAVRFARGDWRGGFGGPDGWPHITIWSGNFHFVQLSEKVFGDDAGLATALTHAARARVFLAAGDTVKAAAAWDAAIAASPSHRDLHLEKIAMQSGRATPTYWKTYAESLLPALGPYGAAGRQIIASASEKFLASADAETALTWFAKENAAYTAATDSWAWDFDKDVLNRQAAVLANPSNPKSGELPAPALRERLFRDALSAQFASEKKPQVGKVVDWGVSSLLEKGEGDAFGRAFASAASSATGKTDAAALSTAYGKAILGVEKARSVNGFQVLGKAAEGFAEKQAPITLNKPEGTLVSDKGMLRVSTTCGWDKPVGHYGVLNETGGFFHTDKEAAPHVIVTLPDNVDVSGVLVTKNNGNEWRMKHMKAYRSTDGETWFPIAEIADMPNQWRIDCPAGTRARWIKIESLPTSPEHFHLRHVLVYSRGK